MSEVDKLWLTFFKGASNHGDEYSMSEVEESDHYNLTMISDGAFNSLPKLAELFLVNVDVFDGVPFLGLKQLYWFVVENGKQSILQKLFDAAPNLDHFSFGNGLEHLEENAFE